MAHQENIIAGDQELISFNDKWYVIEKFDSSDLGYQIVKQLTQKEYEAYIKERNNGTGIGQSIQKGISVFTSIDRGANSTNGSVVSNNSSQSRNGKSDNQVREMGGEQSQGREIERNGRGYSVSRNKGEKGSENGRVDPIRRALPTTDSDGRTLTEQQQDYFKDSKVRDKDGKLLTVYHGSKAKFTEFSHEFISKNGSVFGQGFYFTDAKGMAESYTNSKGQLLKGYLNITKPLSSSEITLSRKELRSLIKELDPTGDNILTGYDTQNGKGYPSKTWYTPIVTAMQDLHLQMTSKTVIKVSEETKTMDEQTKQTDEPKKKEQVARIYTSVDGEVFPFPLTMEQYLNCMKSSETERPSEK